MYACDFRWWIKYQDLWKDFQGIKYTYDGSAASKYGLIRVPSESKPGLGRECMHLGGNSGYQAVNLAYLMGAKRIVLLGFDMQLTDNQVHFHGKHENLNNPNPHLFYQWIRNFDVLAKDLATEGVEALNATRETALTCFQRIKITDL